LLLLLCITINTTGQVLQLAGKGAPFQIHIKIFI